MRRLLNQSAFICLSAMFVLCAGDAHASTIWTDWTSDTLGANGGGSATGVLGGIAVSYSGELDGAVINGTSGLWDPNSSFIGGTVTTSPSSVNDDLRLNGSSTGTNTVTFASSITNPLIAIWSLGAPSAAASFTFNATPTFEAGGSNSQFGGSAITVSGNEVSGKEGNGVVQFTGTFSSISWTDTPENFYAFTVGENGASNVVPEPTSLGLSVLALGLAGLAGRKFHRAQ